MPKRQKQRILYTMVQISDRQTNILRVLRSMYNQSGTTVRESMQRLRRSHHKSSGKVRLPANAPTFFFCVRFFVFLLSFLNHMDGVTPPPVLSSHFFITLTTYQIASCLVLRRLPGYLGEVRNPHRRWSAEKPASLAQPLCPVTRFYR